MGIELNGMRWVRDPNITYTYDYDKIPERIARSSHPNAANSVYRAYLRDDLFFMVYFGLRVPIANHQFWVDACREVQKGPQSRTIDLWAREHGKSTIITVAETIQRILRNPEERVCIFSHTLKNALSFYRSIKDILEKSEFLKTCFPDVLYDNPQSESQLWTMDSGLVVKREGYYREPTLSASGLIDNTPIGAHFTHRLYDDVETHDFAFTPEMLTKLKDAYDMSQNLGTIDGTERVIGTPYHHEGLLTTLVNRKTMDGEPAYYLRKKPATVDGTYNGESVYLPEKKLMELRVNKRMFASQQLLDPTPQGEEALNPEALKEVEVQEIPKHLYKFMTIDAAGDNPKGDSDAWAIQVIGVDPFRDDVGASDIFVLDAIYEPMKLADAIDAVVSMYCRHGRILKVGVEKVGISTTEIHIANALRARGKLLDIKAGNLVLLKPAGRNKKQRIESNLSWALNNAKVHISKAVPAHYRERLRMEMRKFPFGHDDALDGLSYVYDLIKDYRFPKRDVEPERDPFEDTDERKLISSEGWLVV